MSFINHGMMTSGGVMSSVGEKKNMYQIIRDLQLTTGLKVCLDAGAKESWNTGGTKWLDLSGNGYDFFLGVDGSADAANPTFAGTPGGLSSNEYWSFDGGDFFRYDSTNEAWMNNIHKDGAQVTFIFWVWIASVQLEGGGSNGLVGTRGSTLTPNTGFILAYGGGTPDRLGYAVDNSGTDVMTTAGPLPEFKLGRWVFCSYSLNEGVTGTYQIDSYQQQSATNTYVTAATVNASWPMEIGARGAANNALTSGSKMAMCAIWEGTTLTPEQVYKVYIHTKPRLISTNFGSGGIDGYTMLNLHCDGAHGSTSFPDSSFFARTVTAVGAGAFVTAFSGVFSGTSFNMVASADRLTTAASEAFNFGTGDFTIDWWARHDLGDRVYHWDIGAVNNGAFVLTPSTGRLEFYSQSVTVFDTTVGGAFSVGAHHHWALVRNGNTFTVYKDGVLRVQTTNAVAVGSSATGMTIGASGGGTVGMLGEFDEFRVSKGIARWTANFTPPQVPYANV